MILPQDEQAFLWNALAQLEPAVRPVFTARMVEQLQSLADPGAGDVDRALRAAWTGLWTPPLDPEHLALGAQAIAVRAGLEARLVGRSPPGRPAFAHRRPLVRFTSAGRPLPYP